MVVKRLAGLEGIRSVWHITDLVFCCVAYQKVQDPLKQRLKGHVKTGSIFFGSRLQHFPIFNATKTRVSTRKFPSKLQT